METFAFHAKYWNLDVFYYDKITGILVRFYVLTNTTAVYIGSSIISVRFYGSDTTNLITSDHKAYINFNIS